MDVRRSALERWGEVVDELDERRIVVFLDYDGTLTPIVERPELALLPAETRQVLRQLADLCPTAVISGRGREDVTSLVDLDNLYYAGSHGFDVAGPASSGLRLTVAAELAPLLKRVAREIQAAVEEIQGARVEPKRFAVAVHYRQVDPGEVSRLEAAVDRLVADHPELRKTHGKKVFEIRPDFDWDKGKAVLWLLEALGLDGSDVLPLYLGDDVTDEDAFEALRDRGIGIFVSDRPRPTAASYSLADPQEVRQFLAQLVGWLQSRGP